MLDNDAALSGKPLGKFATLTEAEKAMSETERDVFWVAPDGRVYDSMIFSDGACWIDLHADTLFALYELQTTLEFHAQGRSDSGSFTAVVHDAQELEKSFKAALAAIKFKPLKQEKF